MMLTVSLALSVFVMHGHTSLEVSGESQIRALLHKSRPSAKWDVKSLIKLDFDGDGNDDYAVVGVESKTVHVAVVMGPISHKSSVNILTFAIDPGLQKAICGLPAVLEPEPLTYTPQDVGMDTIADYLPNKRAVGLRLSGGDCDKVHLYWSESRKAMLWWRH